MTHVITQPCCNDASCVAVCPVNCIHPTPDEPGYGSAEMLYIDPRTCIDCAACIDVCPVEAIVQDCDLAPRDSRYVELNALYYAGQEPFPPVAIPPAPPVEVATSPLRVAVVGSGPAAMYLAESLLSRRGLDVEVHVFERMPVPGGLLRYGVAPDHPGTKNVAKVFKRTAARRNFRYHLNVEIGSHLSQDDLLEHCHAVVYAVGAPHSRALGIPGEDLPGSHAATDFVGWYNGHPDHAHHVFDLHAERVAVVGNGNVALDVARLLLTDVDVLARTDIADHALKALRESRVREVVLLGRRGPAQAAYTTSELLALSHLPDVDIVADEQDLSGLMASGDTPLAAVKARVAAEYAAHGSKGGSRRLHLRFLVSPVAVVGPDRVTGLRLERNELVLDARGQVSARGTGEVEQLDCGLVLRAVGYYGVAASGLPFDVGSGTLPNLAGRVLDDSGAVLPGVYAVGWAKRGPSGVIGTNKHCAEETARSILADHAAGLLPEPAGDSAGLQARVVEGQPQAVDTAGWQAIDAHERRRAAGTSRPRVKLVTVAEMLEVGLTAGRASA